MNFTIDEITAMAKAMANEKVQDTASNSGLPFGAKVSIDYTGELMFVGSTESVDTKANPNFKDLQDKYRTLSVRPVGRKLPKDWVKNIFETASPRLWEEIEVSEKGAATSGEFAPVTGFHGKVGVITFPFDFKIIGKDGKVRKDALGKEVVTNIRTFVLLDNEQLNTLVRREYRNIIKNKAIVDDGNGIPTAGATDTAEN